MNIQSDLTWEQAAIEALNNLPLDEEAAHGLADDILCNALRDAGYGDIVRAYEAAEERITFWYA